MFTVINNDHGLKKGHFNKIDLTLEFVIFGNKIDLLNNLKKIITNFILI